MVYLVCTDITLVHYGTYSSVPWYIIVPPDKCQRCFVLRTLCSKKKKEDGKEEEKETGSKLEVTFFSVTTLYYVVRKAPLATHCLTPSNSTNTMPHGSTVSGTVSGTI